MLGCMVTPNPKQPSPAPDARATLLPKLLFGYMVVFQIGFLGLGLYQSGGVLGDLSHLNQVLGQPIAQGCYLIGVLAFAAAFVVPKAMLKRALQAPTTKLKLPGSGNNHPLSLLITPFILRLCLFEFCSIMGLALTIREHNFALMLPLVGLGLLGTLSSAPTPSFFDRLRSSAS